MFDHVMFTFRPESTAVIFAGITELLVNSESRSTVTASIDPVFNHLKAELTTLCSSRSGINVFVSAPLFRVRPAWYQQHLPMIASQWSSAMTNGKPPNLHLLPCPVNQELSPDGVNLTPVAGLHYVIHLFDQSVDALALISAPDRQMLSVQESVRSHDDRISYLESKHVFLNHRVNLKTAEDAEFNDWVRNRNEEEWFTISNLPRLPQMDNQAWQVAAKKQVQDVLRLVLQANRVNLSFSILVVVNPIKWRTTGPTVYNVRLSSVEASKRIRELYSGFFRHANPVKLPSCLKGVKLRNKVTLNTKIRIQIMRQLGDRYVESNRGASYKMRGYDPRPILVIEPPPGATGPRFRSLTFTEAVASLPTHFTDEDLLQIFLVAGGSNRDRLRALFVVLSDDDHDRCLELVKKFHQDRRQTRSGPRAASTAVASTPQTHSALVSGLGSGMDAENRPRRYQSSALSFLSQPPPPPPPPVESPSGVDPATKSKTSKSKGESQTVSRKRSRSRSSTPSSRSRSTKHRKSSRPSPSSSGSASSASSSSSGSSSYDSDSDSSSDARRARKPAKKHSRSSRRYSKKHPKKRSKKHPKKHPKKPPRKPSDSDSSNQEPAKRPQIEDHSIES